MTNPRRRLSVVVAAPRLTLCCPSLDESARDLGAAASKDANEIGQAGGKPESDVIHQGATYYGKDKQSVSVTMPLRA